MKYQNHLYSKKFHINEDQLGQFYAFNKAAKSQKYELAIELGKKLLSETGDFPDLLYQFGHLMRDIKHEKLFNIIPREELRRADTNYFYFAMQIDPEFAFAHYYLGISLITVDYNPSVIHHLYRAIQLMEESGDENNFKIMKEALDNYFSLFDGLEDYISNTEYDFPISTDENEYIKINVENSFDPYLFTLVENYIGFPSIDPLNTATLFHNALSEKGINNNEIRFTRNSLVSKGLDNSANLVFFSNNFVIEFMSTQARLGQEIYNWIRKEGDGVSHFKYEKNNQKIKDALKQAGIYFDLRPQINGAWEAQMSMSLVWDNSLTNEEKRANWIVKLVNLFAALEDKDNNSSNIENKDDINKANQNPDHTEIDTDEDDDVLW